jgi:peptidoglycan/xylan/chitin deacetylase (PgdA/CDA1 family)
MKLGALGFLKHTGAFARIRDSRWRSERLLILCYHGVALEDEHEWRPKLYLPPAALRERFEALRRGGYQVLPLGEALERLYQNALPPRSVALTFDDGGYDFYLQASPVLREFGYPATVYQTTYYSDYARPIFNLGASYLLWKRRGEVLQPPPDLGLGGSWDLGSEDGRRQVVGALEQVCLRESLSGSQKNALLERLSQVLGLDYAAFVSQRLLQIMRPEEIAEMARAGFDIQLHTHRHRTPLEETLFRREITDNRRRIVAATGRAPLHFCYPSGHYETAFLPWLEREGVLSATTCDPALASRDSHPLLLPRFVDTGLQPLYVFEAWLSGAGHLVSARRPAEAARASERARVSQAPASARPR